MSEQLLSKKDVAKLWGISPRTIDRYRAAGALPYIRIGQQVRFRQAVIDKIIETKKGIKL